MKKAGMFILALGLMIILFTSFDFITREKVLNVGNLEITEKRNHRLPWSPLVGIAVIVIGGGIWMVGGRQR